MQTIFKVFIEFVTLLLLFYVLVFFSTRCGISSLTWDFFFVGLTPWPGIKPTPPHPALVGGVLTTGPPGKSKSPEHQYLKKRPSTQPSQSLAWPLSLENKPLCAVA